MQCINHVRLKLGLIPEVLGHGVTADGPDERLRVCVRDLALVDEDERRHAPRRMRISPSAVAA